LEGWISLHRKIQKHWLWDDKPFSKGQAWIDIIMMVNHEDGKAYFRDSVYEVKRGQRITSELQLAERWGWSRNKVRNFLNTLEKEQMLKVKKDKRKTVLEVVNYNAYQDNKTTKGTTESTSVRTTEGQQKDINNNDNNENKEINNIIIINPEEAQFLKVLETIQNYPLDRKKDLDMYKRLKERYPELDLIESIKDWAMYKQDKPLKAKDNPRSQINTSFKNYVKWGRNLKKGKSLNSKLKSLYQVDSS
jgi:DNA-binding transcriptional regulator YhcF (GntR family)